MNTAFTAASHHDVLMLLIQVAMLLLVARVLGEIAQRLGQPSVVGEILSGVILGPSLLSSLIPAFGLWMVPQTPVQGYLLEVVALIGVMFLLLITGLETDIPLIRRRASTAVGASIGGITLTFSTGLLLGWYLPDSLLASDDQRVVFALFVATAMSISAIPVIAKVLMDMNLMRRDIGQTIIATGMIDDSVGWMLLSVVAGLAAGDAVTGGTVLRAVGSVVFIIFLSFTAGRWLVKRSLDYVQDEVISRDRLLTLVVVLTFAWGAMTHALHLEAVLGAFFMGIIFGQMPRLPRATVHKIESMTLGVFAPVFFGVAGLKVNVGAILTPQLIGITLLVIFVASFGKIVGVYTGARLGGGVGHWTALSLGSGMNARGAMEIIVATIGFSLGILTQDMYSIIVVMAVATSVMAPPALRWALSHVVPEQQELDRLEREELRAGSKIAQIHRVLVPVRQRPGGADIEHVKGFALQRLGAEGPLSVTLLNVAAPGTRAAGAEYLAELESGFGDADVTRRVVESTDPIDVILAEAAKDYDLLVVGATESANGAALFHPIVDELVRMAPCPTLVVSGSPREDQWPPNRILVPTNGSAGSRAAAEVAFALSAPDASADVVIVNVVQERESHEFTGSHERLSDKFTDTGQQMVDDLARLGENAGARVRTEVRRGAVVEDELIKTAVEGSSDLIILGTDVRVGSGRLFLGPTVERILSAAPCPVLVINGV